MNDQQLPEPVVLERIVQAPIGMVWTALTDIAVLQKWLPFFPDFRAEVGFETRFKLGPSEDRQYEHICQVTEVEEGKKLTYSWRYAGYAGDAYVTFDLASAGTGTSITLTYRVTELFPLDNADFAASNARIGWGYTLDGLQKFAEA
jgi:uncharacterized protein YndB with AHSA1/START domain